MRACVFVCDIDESLCLHGYDRTSALIFGIELLFASCYCIMCADPSFISLSVEILMDTISSVEESGYMVDRSIDLNFC